MQGAGGGARARRLGAAKGLPHFRGPTSLSRPSCHQLSFQPVCLLVRAQRRERAEGRAPAGLEPPEEFLDPITAGLMSDPVTLPDSGVTLDRTTVQRHLMGQVRGRLLLWGLLTAYCQVRGRAGCCCGCSMLTAWGPASVDLSALEASRLRPRLPVPPVSGRGVVLGVAWFWAWRPTSTVQCRHPLSPVRGGVWAAARQRTARRAAALRCGGAGGCLASRVGRLASQNPRLCLAAQAHPCTRPPARTQATDPFSRKPLTMENVVPDRALADRIRRWRATAGGSEA